MSEALLVPSPTPGAPAIVERELGPLVEILAKTPEFAGGASETELEAVRRWAVAHKELKHKITDPGFVRASRSMSQIGG